MTRPPRSVSSPRWHSQPSRTPSRQAAASALKVSLSGGNCLASAAARLGSTVRPASQLVTVPIRDSNCGVMLADMICLLDGKRVHALGGDGGERRARALHGNALMIEPQAAQAAELGAVAGAAWPAMQAVGHDDAVTGLRFADRGIDQQQAAMAVAERRRGIGEETRIGAEHR